jgi:glycerol uptake facilitator-like aquaporin
LTNSFSGIRPMDLPGFIAAQIAGAVCALALVSWLLRAPATAIPSIKAEAQL